MPPVLLREGITAALPLMSMALPTGTKNANTVPHLRIPVFIS